MRSTCTHVRSVSAWLPKIRANKLIKNLLTFNLELISRLHGGFEWSAPNFADKIFNNPVRMVIIPTYLTLVRTVIDFALLLLTPSRSTYALM